MSAARAGVVLLAEHRESSVGAATAGVRAAGRVHAGGTGGTWMPIPLFCEKGTACRCVMTCTLPWRRSSWWSHTLCGAAERVWPPLCEMPAAAILELSFAAPTAAEQQHRQLNVHFSYKCGTHSRPTARLR